MTANVDSMFSHRQIPWHGTEHCVILDAPPTAAEAMKFAGLDKPVEKFPVTIQLPPTSLGDELDGAEPRAGTVLGPIDGRWATVWDPWGDPEYLGMVSDRYQVHPAAELFGFADDLVMNNQAVYETAGSLGGHRKIWLCMELPDDIMVGGVDQVKMFIFLATSFDGSMSTTAGVTPVRTVCENTLNMAIEAAVRSWSIRHTDVLGDRAEEARKALDLTLDYSKRFADLTERMIETPFAKSDFEGMVREVFPGKASGMAAFTPEQYSMIGVLESSPTIDDAFRYTAWGAVNAVREWDDWGRITRSGEGAAAENRLERTLWGDNVKRTDKVVEYLQPALAGR